MSIALSRPCAVFARGPSAIQSADVGRPPRCDTLAKNGGVTVPYANRQDTRLRYFATPHVHGASVRSLQRLENQAHNLSAAAGRSILRPCGPKSGASVSDTVCYMGIRRLDPSPPREIPHGR
jgi:hypothetical protein